MNVAQNNSGLKDKQIQQLKSVVTYRVRLQEICNKINSAENLDGILINLIDNAIKYGDPGRTMEVDIKNTGDLLRFSITDFGYGISLEDQKKVFEKFFRVKSNAKSARVAGTGLGLAYVKEIVNQHKGEIKLESNEEIGSRFTIDIPIKPESES